MGGVLPQQADWIKDKVVEFKPEENKVKIASGEEISYDFLVVAMGINLRYDLIKGLEDRKEAFKASGLCSNYHPTLCEKTWKEISSFKEGNAVFTFPNTPIKCAGAPQKIMYLAEKNFRKAGVRQNAKVHYHAATPKIFGVPKYAEALWKVVKERDINVTLRSNLIEVRPEAQEAVFEDLDNRTKSVVNYAMLHVTPPMTPPEAIKTGGSDFADDAGFLKVNKLTLQQEKFKNVFGIGDCHNIPVSKTAAAVAGQIAHLERGLQAAMEMKEPNGAYDGYTSCPLITGDGECILAEFDYETPPVPMETFPFNQAQPRWLPFFLKKHVMPHIYWQMLKGRWHGPKIFRKLFHLGMTR